MDLVFIIFSFGIDKFFKKVWEGVAVTRLTRYPH